MGERHAPGGQLCGHLECMEDNTDGLDDTSRMTLLAQSGGEIPNKSEDSFNSVMSMGVAENYDDPAKLNSTPPRTMMKRTRQQIGKLYLNINDSESKTFNTSCTVHSLPCTVCTLYNNNMFYFGADVSMMPCAHVDNMGSPPMNSNSSVDRIPGSAPTWRRPSPCRTRPGWPPTSRRRTRGRRR